MPVTTEDGSLFTKPLYAYVNAGSGCPYTLVRFFAVTVSTAGLTLNDWVTEAAL